MNDLISEKPDDSSGNKVGWIIKEHVGIGIINTYAVLPWYKKLRYMKFYIDLYRKVIWLIKKKLGIKDKRERDFKI